MKRLQILLLGLVSILPSIGYAGMCEDFAGAELISPDGTYLGMLDANQFNTKSISNQFGNYGNQFNSKSIFNQFGSYGSKFSNTSPWNTFATKPPLIKKGGVTMGTLTLNRYTNGAQNTFDILYCFIDLSDSRLEPFAGLNPGWHASTYATPGYSFGGGNYTLTEEQSCQLQYGSNATAGDPGYCKCKAGYKRNSTNTACIKLTDSESCQLQYGINSTAGDPGKCICKDGYERNSSRTSCIKKTASCSSYGPNSYLGTDDLCYCKDGYEWNSSMTYCIEKTASCSEYGPNSYLGTDNQCYCKNGYGWDTPDMNRCVSITQSCKGRFGENSIASGNECSCKNGYGWDSPSQNSCVAIEASCKGWFGKNSYAGTDNLCYCKDGYEWNGSMTSCVESAKTNVIQSYDGAMPHSFTDAYNFAFKNGITTMETMDKADMYGSLDRIAMAKMIGNYAINILGLTPDLTQSCYFSDVPEDVNIAYDNGVTKACQLGLMGQGIKKFMPFAKVTRAEFATVLSRLLNRDSDDLARLNSADPYYTEHMKYLEDNGIIDSYVNLGIFDSELRGNVMLMLLRADTLTSNSDEGGCTAEELLSCLALDDDEADACFAACTGE